VSAVAAVKPQRRGRAQQWPPAGWHMDDNGEIQHDVATAVADALTSIDQQMRAKAATVHSLAGDEDKRLVVQTAAQFFEQRQAPRWHVKRVIPEAELVAIVGEPSAGKTPFAVSLAGSIHRGTEWFGHRVRKGRVVYVFAEAPGDGRNRYAAYMKEHGITLTDMPDIIADVPNLKTPQDAALLAKRIGKADVIVFDVFASVFIGDENSGSDVGPVLTHLKFRLFRFKCG